MNSYDIECPMCELTEWTRHPDGMYECHVCNTSWGVDGIREPITRPDDFALKVNAKLRKYIAE